VNDHRPEPLLSADEVASFLSVPVATLYQWRHKGTGPKGIRVGRHLRYRRQELDAWLDSLVAATARDHVQ
jgi:excisionase family DNA binding protein